MLKNLLILLLLSAVGQGFLFRRLSRKIHHNVINGIRQFERTFDSKNLKLVKFDWKSCGSSGDLATINSLDIHPLPIHIPGNVTISFSGSLSQNLASPIQVSLDIKKKELFWIPVPCMDQMGSCDYDDICLMAAKAKCPPEFKKAHLPCQCPISSGNYKIPPTEVEIPSFGMPSWLEDGEFKVTVKASNKGKEVMCLNLSFTLK